MLQPKKSAAANPKQPKGDSFSRMSPEERQSRITELQHRLATEPRITELQLDELLKNYLPGEPVDWGKPKGREVW